MKKIQILTSFLIIIQIYNTQSKITHTCSHTPPDPSEVSIADEDPQENNRRNLRSKQKWEPLRITTDFSHFEPMEEKMKTFFLKIGKLAQQFFFDNLLVRRKPSINKFPSWKNNCHMKSQIPKLDKKTGIPDSDIHFYLTYNEDYASGSIAWASECVLDYKTARPLFANINWNIVHLLWEDIEKEKIIQTYTEVMIHEMTHAIAFSSDLYYYWIDPRTDRRYRGSITQRSYANGETFYYLTTPNVKAFAQKHYNCSNAIGMPLENRGQGIMGSHWEKTVLENEFMTAEVVYNDGIYSNFTFAMFEDSGWYKPTYKNVDEALWGKDKGCDFLTSCDPKKFIEFDGKDSVQFCTFDHTAVATLPYWDPYQGNECEIPKARARICTHDQSWGKGLGGEYTGEIYGQNSRCFKSDLKNPDAPFPMSTYKQMLDEVRCLQYECDSSDGISVIINEENYELDRITNQVDVKPKGINQNITGIVNGPEDWHAFCHVYPKPCKNFCSKNGYCLAELCHCLPDFAGNDCSIPCLNNNVVHNEVCLQQTICPQGSSLKQETKECIEDIDPCTNQINFNNQCKDSCPLRTFQDGNTCRHCPKNCIDCDNSTTCIQCSLNHYTHNNECVKVCPSGYYGNEEDFTCNQCSMNCSQCENEQNCIKCTPNFYLLFDKQSQTTNCVIQCPKGYLSQNQKCLQCQQGCEQCSSQNNCIQCASIYWTIIDNKYNNKYCSQKCPLGSVRQNTNKICIICASNQVYFQEKCQQECPEGYFQNENTCLKCESPCQACSSFNNCQSCISGFQLDYQSQKCTEYLIKCPSGCSSCRNPYSCDQCEKNKIRYVNSSSKISCLDKCPTGYEEKRKACVKVVQKEKESKGTGSTKCGPKKYEYTTIRGFSFCVSRCFRNSKPNVEGKCV